MTSITMDEDMDMSMRAPYISMSEADDLPLLISEDLMWGALPCDGPKFQPEPKLNVIVDMATMQARQSLGQALASVKAGDYLLSNGNPATTSLLSTVSDAEVSLMLSSSSSSSRKKSGVLLQGGAEEEERVKGQQQEQVEQTNGKVIGMVLLQQGVGASSSSCSSEDTNQSIFDDSMTKNCEWLCVCTAAPDS